jgi:hypothetical protein
MLHHGYVSLQLCTKKENKTKGVFFQIMVLPQKHYLEKLTPQQMQ